MVGKQLNFFPPPVQKRGVSEDDLRFTFISSIF